MSTHQQRAVAPNRTHSRLRLLDQFLETNGLGGYCCGTLGGVRQWPTQGMVVVAKHPPIDRYVLLSGFDVRIEFEDEVIPLSTNRFGDGRFEPDGRKRFIQFESRPWPSWIYDLGRGRILQFECLARHGSDQFVFSWHLEVCPTPAILRVRPLISGRPVNSTRKESKEIDLIPERPSPRQFVWKLPQGAPTLALLSDGEFEEDGYWLKDQLYDHSGTEDLASPGEFRWELTTKTRAQIIGGTADAMSADPRTANEVAHLANKLRNAERTRRKLFRSGLDLAADQYIVDGAEGKTVISGFPLGTEKGSQALIASRGICLSPGRLDVVGSVLETWRNRIACGMIPSHITEHQRSPNYDSPESSLWYIIAVYEYCRASDRNGRILGPAERERLTASIRQILTTFLEHLNWRAYMDEDGLLAEIPVKRLETDTGRVSCQKRVEVQTLWITALWIGSLIEPKWKAQLDLTRAGFEQSFWSEDHGYLTRALRYYPHAPMERDNSLCLEQILAIGGLPLVSVDEGKASLIVSALENRFFTLDRIKNATCFPWLFGPFIEAWYRVRHRDPDVLKEAKERFIDLWEAQLRSGGHNHLAQSPINEPYRPDHTQPTDLTLAMFSAAETAELLRILHLPDLRRNEKPFEENPGGLFEANA